MPGVLKAKMLDGSWVPVGGGGITQFDADARYVNIPGDTMSGHLIAPTAAVTDFVSAARFLHTGAQPNDVNGATRKDYVDRIARVVHMAVGGNTVSNIGAGGVGVCYLNFPAQSVAGILMVVANCHVTASVATDTFQTEIRFDNVSAENDRNVGSGTRLLSHVHSLAANTATAIGIVLSRLAGTGTASTVNDSTFHSLRATWLAT